MFFKKNHPTPIQVFVRHCHFSSVSAHKKRFSDFSREKCHQNLLATSVGKEVHFTFFLDTYHVSKEPHFIRKYPVVEIKEGTEAGSFLKMLDHVSNLKLSKETIIYFLEDDYIHREGWVDVLLEGFTIPEVDYVTLYDHKDKYSLPTYQNLESKIYHTQSCHWRITPSTTNTYAMKFGTLKRHLDVHKQFSRGRAITADHDKFCALHHQGSRLISSLPGFATHAEPEYASPCFDWNVMFTKIN